MLSMVRQDPIAALRPDGQPLTGATAMRTPDELQRLLDGLLTDDQVESYTAEDYNRALQEADGRAQRWAAMRPPGTMVVPAPPHEGERHFLLVGRELLGGSQDDGELRSILRR